MTDTHTPDLSTVRRKLARATNAMHAVTKNASANLGDKIGDVKFADIGMVLTVVKEALQYEGLSLQQPFGIHHNTGQTIITVDTVITDTISGDYVMFQGPGFPVKGAPQDAGGAITYFRRYALVTLFGLIVEDDDATQATRAERTPDKRTEAETEIRQWLSSKDPDTKARFAADFQEAFGSTLTNLPQNRHGDALTFQKQWASTPPEPRPNTPEN